MSKQRLMPPGHWDWSTPPTLSQGWKTGELIFVGGQLSLDGRGQTVGRDVEAQTRNIMESIQRVASEGGAGIAAQTRNVFENMSEILTAAGTDLSVRPESS
jgi:enamine deaminase RidA (YjgF/YER057c/UK114 family)|tara:strand:- start:20 stop:322 length:303 start_codon:yes stop_codon:yes gene_type:complete